MSGPGSLIYKCRACGEFHYPTHTPDGWKALTVLRNDLPNPERWHGFLPTATDVHRCTDRIAGVSDFVGVQFDDPIGPESRPG